MELEPWNSVMATNDIPLRRDRPRPVLRRQRPAVGLLLSQRLRLRRGRLRRPGDQGQARGRLRPAAGRNHLRARLAAAARTPGRASGSCTHGDGVMDIALEVDDVADAFDDGRRARRRRRSKPPRSARGRVRRLRVRHHPRLRRHDAHASSTATATGRLRPRLQADRPGALQPGHVPARSASPPSTTSSATSRKAR